jgi:predicted DCC family thiol-disulfide oxidoreductase YuxK
VRLGLHVATPPQKPVLIWDGDCNFCQIWINRWKCSTEDRVEYVPFQDPQVPARFPELPSQGFTTAVHLIETNGLVYAGAEAAFRALAHSPGEPLLLDWYLRWSWFRRFTEASYGFVARHRRLFSILTRIGWGRRVEPSSYELVRWILLRGLGVIYLIAFLSLSPQVMGLIGSNGILPASLTMFGVRQESALAHLGWQRYDILPTLCWFSASDTFLKLQCVAGAILALLLILGIAPALCLFLLWLIYLSLSTVCREFLSFQWDVLLLEAGLLALFFAPLGWLPRLGRSTPPSRLMLWLLRWLVFRLMLGSGLVKWLGGDPAWRNLTALKFHYETQPLPTWIGWYAHQLPLSVQRFSTGLVLGIELLLPFLIFAPRRLRQISCAGFIFLQLLILLTGNYCFFNLLAILLCLVLVDDAVLVRFLPKRCRQRVPAILIGQQEPTTVSLQSEAVGNDTPMKSKRNFKRWPIQVTFPLTILAALIPLVQSTARLRLHVPWPPPLITLFTWVSPLRSFNTYGLFEVMTTNRLEIIVQGSNDGVHWSDYEFKYKPGAVNRRPGFVEPHQPRLDWQMWFAAFGDYRQNPWFVEFCVRLLTGSPQVLGLLEHNPFPQGPPRQIRALLYEYHFTDLATRRRTGAWWRRELKGQYLPVISQPTRGNQ